MLIPWKNKIKDFDILLDAKYGKRGIAEREEWEQELETFKIGVLIEEARKKEYDTSFEADQKVILKRHSELARCRNEVETSEANPVGLNSVNSLDSSLRSE